MVELILAGVIIAAVMTAAAVTGIWDRRRRKEERRAEARNGQPYGEPIPGGWMAANGVSGAGLNGGALGDSGCAGGDGGGC